jgi:hypothetical protein
VSFWIVFHTLQVFLLSSFFKVVFKSIFKAFSSCLFGLCFIHYKFSLNFFLCLQTAYKMSFSAAEISALKNFVSVFDGKTEEFFIGVREDKFSVVVKLNADCVKPMGLAKLKFPEDEEVDRTRFVVTLVKGRIRLTFYDEDMENELSSKLISDDFADWTSVLSKELSKIDSDKLFSSSFEALTMSDIKSVLSSSSSSSSSSAAADNSFVGVDAYEEILDFVNNSNMASIFNTSVKENLALTTLNNVVLNTIEITMATLGINDKDKKEEVMKKCKDKNLLLDSKKIKESKPKRGISAYIAFSNEKRDEVRAANPQSKITDVSTILGKMWKSLTKEQQDEYKEKAVKINEEREKNPSSSRKASSKKGSKKGSTKSKPKHTCEFILKKGERADEPCGTGVKSEEPNHDGKFYCSKHLKSLVEKEKKPSKKSDKKSSKKSDDEKPKKKAKKSEEEEKPKKKVKKTNDDEEEKPKKAKKSKDESDDEEEEKPKKKVKKTDDEEKPKKKPKKSKDESDDEEEEEEEKSSKKTKASKVVDLSDDEEEEEEEKSSKKTKASKVEEVSDDEEEEDDDDEDDELVKALSSPIKIADLIKKPKNGLLVCANNLVWNREKIPQGRYVDGKCVDFNSKEQRTVDVWMETNDM